MYIEADIVCIHVTNVPSFDGSLLVWLFQAGQSSTVIENIHTIIAAAAVKFSFDQLTHLFVLIQKVSAVSVTCWEEIGSMESVFKVGLGTELDTFKGTD